MEPSQDAAVGTFLASVWSTSGKLTGKTYLFTGTVADADALKTAAHVLGAEVGQTTPHPNHRRVTISWAAVNSRQNRNAWPYGKTPLQALSFLVRGDVEARCRAFLDVGLELQEEGHAQALWSVAATVCKEHEAAAVFA